jgi:hypothetical protein
MKKITSSLPTLLVPIPSLASCIFMFFCPPAAKREREFHRYDETSRWFPLTGTLQWPQDEVAISLVKAVL